MGSETGLVLTGDMMLVMVVLIATIGLFVSELVRVDIAAIAVMVVVGLLGLVPPTELFNGFASNAVISIIAVMILGAGLDRTGVMLVIAAWILKVGGSTANRIIPLLCATTGLIGGFMQNVAAVALFMPVTSRIASRTKIPLSSLLMPVAFSSVLGGTLTMSGPPR
jgi:Na+/H+ antiporter NhaD/arsenite permease-like protein